MCCKEVSLTQQKNTNDTADQISNFSLVIIEASLILARILFDFDMELQLPSSHDWPKRNGHLVPNKRPLFLRVKEDTVGGNITKI